MTERTNPPMTQMDADEMGWRGDGIALVGEFYGADPANGGHCPPTWLFDQ
jgi:hypothetical protein